MANNTFQKRIDSSARALYCASHMSELHPVQQKLIESTKQQPKSNMAASPDSVMLLSTMLRFAGAKRCIDVGVYTGYSSLSWALHLPEDGKVVALDIDPEMPEFGRGFWKEAGVEHKIDFKCGNAVDAMKAMIANGEEGTYDFMFIDADKPGYGEYYELGLKLIRTNGLIAIDNCWWSGRVIGDQTDDDTEAIKSVNAKVKSDKRVTAVLIDTGDGVFVCAKN